MSNIVQLCPGNDKIGMAFNERMKVPVAISNKLGVLASKDPATPWEIDVTRCFYPAIANQCLVAQ